jgi:hypothetical protein
MGSHRLAPAALLACTLALASGCSGGSGDPPVQPVGEASPSSPGTSSAADPEHPQGVVAIGHSALTGLSSDADRPQENAPENSWATGTNPAVDSVYLRLVKERPETEGHVANTAKNGAVAQTLPEQAEAALDQVPFPALLIIQTIDNDIRCDGSDDAHLHEFRASVREAVEMVSEASPKTHVLVVSNFGSPAGYAKSLTADPVAVAGFAGTDPCSLFAGDGTVNAKGVATLSAIIAKYEAEQVRACEGIALCHSDDGALDRYPERLEDLASDRQHLLSTGHAELAKAIWPTVEKILGAS